MDTLTVRGGARVGDFNVTWPFAQLTVTKDAMLLDVLTKGTFSFKPDEVISITAVHGGFSRGLDICFNKNDSRGNVIFWTFKNTDKLLKRIKQLGFPTRP